MNTQQDPPAVACLRCRKQKLRCSRERPQCRRCQKAGTHCGYPAPPDRKRLALARAQEKSTQPTGSQAQPLLGNPGPPTAQDPDPRDSLPPTQHRTAYSGGDGTSYDSRALLAPFGEMSVSSLGHQAFPVVQVSKEVALFLFEIFFERHYQSDLLFNKKKFIEEYTSGKVGSHVVLAIFAFSSLFLHPIPGGIFQGDIDIAEVALVDWRVVGRLWGEQASQLALMTADKPRLDLVQACQILALFWFAKGESTRTNMHTAIAYRASRLLHFDQVRLNETMDGIAERGHGIKCFWACWLTKCASLENSRFEVDCWACVEGRPLPSDSIDQEDSAADTLASCLDKNGSLFSPAQGTQLGFNAVLVMVQGLWWEAQRFVRLIHGNQGSPEQWATKYCSLDQRLQSLPDQLAKYGQPILSTPISEAPPSELSRTFSVKYMYELCLLYLHSSVVPVLSCRTQIPNFSRSMLQLAGEQAWEYSKRMTAMAEQYISSKASISKLWPIAGYGAYVCAAVQLRRCFAFGLLGHAEIQSTRINLHLTAELCKYWSHLRLLFEDMDRQFVQATTLARSREAEKDREHEKDRPSSLIKDQASSMSPALSSHIRAYVAPDDEKRDHLEDTAPLSTSGEASDRSNQAWSLPPLDQRSVSTTATGAPFGEADGMSVGLVDNDWEMKLDPIWWNQDPEMLGELFGSGCLLLDNLGNLLDIC